MFNVISSLAKSPVYSVGGDLVHILTDSATTQGAHVLIHTTTAPGGGPPLHTHTREDETFYIIDGTLTFTIENERGTLDQIDAPPGSVVFAPRGKRHTFSNRTESIVRALTFITPGTLDAFFRDGGIEMPLGTSTPVPPTEAGIAKLIAACQKFGIRIHMPE
jgi:quercetin dioxygenase-like cupin family protein